MTYVGRFATGLPTYWMRRIPDQQGGERDGIIFNLEPVDASVELLSPPDAEFAAPMQMTWSPPAASDIVLEGVVQADRVVTRVEFELQGEFGVWLKSKGMAVHRLLLNSEGIDIEPDIYVPEWGWIIEAKKSTSRELVRMAIGQVLDYAYVAEHSGIAAVPVILLPGWPVRELLNLAQKHGIMIVVRDERSDGFILLSSRTGRPIAAQQAGQVLPIQEV